jgi:hypothetical protein
MTVLRSRYSTKELARQLKIYPFRTRVVLWQITDIPETYVKKGRVLAYLRLRLRVE